MNLRKNILTALLIAIGFVLHQAIPGTIGSMKFDLMLSVIFVALLINKDAKSTILVALLGGIISAATTTFPGGQIPNLIDKIVTCTFVYILIVITNRIKFKQITVGVISFLGTLVSGTVFLYSAMLIAGLPAPFAALFFGIVLPTSITNIFVTLLVYNTVNIAIKASGIQLVQE